MAQQNAATDDAQTTNDPELAAATLAEAADSLQTHMTRSEMRSAARDWGTRSSGTKQEMAEAMLEGAEEQALAYLVEEGVELLGDLADDEEAEEEAEEEEQDDDSSSGRSRTTVGERLTERPAERHGALRMTEKQTAVLARCLEQPEATPEEVGEACDVSPRYAETTAQRWLGTEEQVAAVEDSGTSVPDVFVGLFEEGGA